MTTLFIRTDGLDDKQKEKLDKSLQSKTKSYSKQPGGVKVVTNSPKNESHFKNKFNALEEMNEG